MNDQTEFEVEDRLQRLRLAQWRQYYVRHPERRAVVLAVIIGWLRTMEGREAAVTAGQVLDELYAVFEVDVVRSGGAGAARR